MLEHFFKGSQTPERLRHTFFGKYFDLFAAELVRGGYAVHSGWLQINTVECFGLWLRKNGIAISALVDEHTFQYVRYRKRKQMVRRGDMACLRRLLSLLRRLEVIAAQGLPTPASESVVTNEFVQFLKTQRGLADSTILYYAEFAGCFLRDSGVTAVDMLGSLHVSDIISFVHRQASIIKSKRVKLMTTALRSFLRYALYRGYIETDLAAAVPTVAHWAMGSLPKALDREHIATILQNCNRDTTIGCRDYAILILLARLGLRAGEVTALTLDDIDWQQCSISIRGKGGNCSKMPIPMEVGKAITAYLQKRNGAQGCRALFLRSRAPRTGLGGEQAVGSVVERALTRSGIISNRNGAHQLRHALACEMLRQNASLKEIGELLRHRTPQSTMIYAKVDLTSLRKIALQWPGGVR
jgi:integrase/recombinase XerD